MAANKKEVSKLIRQIAEQGVKRLREISHTGLLEVIAEICAYIVEESKKDVV